MKKNMSLFALAVLLGGIVAGCAPAEEQPPATDPAVETPVGEEGVGAPVEGTLDPVEGAAAPAEGAAAPAEGYGAAAPAEGAAAEGEAAAPAPN